MPSAKKMEQCMTWLHSQAADQNDILNAINAQIAIEIIQEQKQKLNDLGRRYGVLVNRNRDYKPFDGHIFAENSKPYME